MRKYNTILSIIFMAAGAGGIMIARDFKQIGGNAGDPGAKFWPIMLCIGMILAAAALLIRTLLEKSNPEEGPLIDYSSKGIHCVFLIFGIMILYAVLLYYVGFLISTFIFAALVMLAMGERNWIKVLVTAAGITIFIYVLFAKLMGVILPSGKIF